MNSSETFATPSAGLASSTSAMIYLSAERFDDADSCFAGHGFDYSITIGDILFTIRGNLNSLGEFIVVSPLTARQSPEARQLVNYLVSVIGCQRLYFYDDWNDMYREVDLQTLEFQASENCAEEKLALN
jgi:hypothetical protein